MAHSLHFPLLEELGLSLNEAKVYELLLEKGASKPTDLQAESGLSRGNAYNVLEALTNLGLALKIHGKQVLYAAVDPAQLRLLLEKKLAETHRLKFSFDQTLPAMLSLFNRSTGKPAIEIFEGLEGVEQLLEDTLTAMGEILTLVDLRGFNSEIERIEKRYIKKRIEKKIPKRVLLPDVDLSHDVLKTPDQPLTKTRIAVDMPEGFASAMEIYDDRVSLLSLSGDRIISVLIKHAGFAGMQRAMFESLWKSSRT